VLARSVVALAVGMSYSTGRMDQADDRSQRSSTLPRQQYSAYSREFGYSSEPRQRVIHVSIHMLVTSTPLGRRRTAISVFVCHLSLFNVIVILALHPSLLLLGHRHHPLL